MKFNLFTISKFRFQIIELRRVGLFALCACAMTILQACGGTDSGQAVNAQVHGFVRTSAPIANMTLQFYAGANDRDPQVEGFPIATAKTTVNGLFVSSQFLSSSSSLTAPTNFRVTASGGTLSGQPFKGALRAHVRNYRYGQTVHINAVTTLVAAYFDATAGISLTDAETAVGRFLKLNGQALGSAYVPFDSLPFSHTAFHQAADSQININTYIATLVAEMKASPTATRSLGGSPAKAALSASLQSNGKTNVRAAHFTLPPGSTGVISKVAGSAIGGVGGAVATAGLDIAFSYFGLNGKPAVVPDYTAQFAQLNQTLEEIKTQLYDLQGQLSDVNRNVLQSTYQTVVGNNQLLLNDITTNIDNINTLAAVTNDHYVAYKDYYDNLKLTYRNNLRTLTTTGSSKIQLHNVMIGNTSQARSLISLVYELITTGNAFYNSQMNSDYSKVVNYWQNAQIALFGLILAENQLEGADPKINIDYINLFVGNATSNGFNSNLAPSANSQLGIQNAMIPNKLPDGTLYDLNNNLLIQEGSNADNAYKLLYLTTGAATQHSRDTDLGVENRKLTAPWRLPTPTEASNMFNKWHGDSPAAWAVANGWPVMWTSGFTFVGIIWVPSQGMPTKMATSDTLTQTGYGANFVRGRSFDMKTGQLVTTSSWVRVNAFAENFANYEAPFDASFFNEPTGARTSMKIDSSGLCMLHTNYRYLGPDPRLASSSDDFDCSTVDLNFYYHVKLNEGYGSDLVNLIPVRDLASGEFYKPAGK